MSYLTTSYIRTSPLRSNGVKEAVPFNINVATYAQKIFLHQSLTDMIALGLYKYYSIYQGEPPAYIGLCDAYSTKKVSQCSTLNMYDVHRIFLT
jgi:hypothetical protein